MVKKINKISVLMPAYNAEKFIGEAIESVLKQTFKDFEFIIIDDCSTDNTWKIIQKYAKKDKRIKGFKNDKNLGCTGSLNVGLKKCSGEYIARMDADDVCFNDRFETQLKLFPKFDVVGGNITLIDSKGKLFGKRIYSHDIANTIKIENPLAHPTVMFKRILVEKYGCYSPYLKSSQDYDLWFRFFLKGCKIYNLNSFVLNYRLHKNQIKNTNMKRVIKDTIYVKKIAVKNGLKLGLKGTIRLFLENVLLLLPNWFVLKLFYMIKKK